MVKREIIISRIDKLNEYINILKSVRKYNKKEYIADPFIYGSAESINLSGCSIKCDSHFKF